MHWIDNSLNTFFEIYPEAFAAILRKRIESKVHKLVPNNADRKQNQLGAKLIKLSEGFDFNQKLASKYFLKNANHQIHDGSNSFNKHEFLINYEILNKVLSDKIEETRLKPQDYGLGPEWDVLTRPLDDSYEDYIQEDERENNETKLIREASALDEEYLESRNLHFKETELFYKIKIAGYIFLILFIISMVIYLRNFDFKVF